MWVALKNAKERTKSHSTKQQALIITINSLAPGRFEWNFRQIIFKLILVIFGWGISYEIALRWMSLDLTDDRSTLVQVMAWCRQATSHYLSQCWPRSMSPYGVTRPQWVNTKHEVRACFHLHGWAGLSRANEKKTFISNMFSHWLRPCLTIDRKWA